jgi:predicted dehydrogenase
MVLDVVKAGKDIYCEKGFSRTLAEARLMRDALKQSKAVFQLGQQQALNLHPQRAPEG